MKKLRHWTKEIEVIKIGANCLTTCSISLKDMINYDPDKKEQSSAKG